MHNQQHRPAPGPPAKSRTIHPFAMQPAMRPAHEGRFSITMTSATPGHIPDQAYA